jgi:hypothetical protein
MDVRKEIGGLDGIRHFNGSLFDHVDVLILTADEVTRLAGYDAALIGSALMADENPAQALAEIVKCQ